MCQNRRTKKHLSTEQVSNRILAVIGILTLLLAFVSVRSTMGENSSSAANTEAYPAPQAETIAYANESIASDVNSQANISYTSSAANTTSSGGQITDRGFGGHRHDAELGLIYMNGRYYVPSAGRFVSPDPVVPNPANPQAWNRYSYVYNNPVTLSDPTGHIPCYMYCPQETYDPVQGQFMANYAGPWDVDQQRANAARAEAFFRGTAETIVGMAYEPADWAIALSDGFQWYDGVGMLPIVPAAWGNDAARALSRAIPTGLFNKGDEIIQFGSWVAKNNPDVGWSRYQEFVTGVRGMEFNVNGVDFDGVIGTLNSAGNNFNDLILLDAKHWSYDFVDSMVNGGNASIYADKINDARRQVAAANGINIQWHFHNQDAADLWRQALQRENITGIDVIYTPWE